MYNIRSPIYVATVSLAVPILAASFFSFSSSHCCGCIFFRCDALLAFELNVRSQKSQLYSTSPVCDAMCS